MLKLFEGEKMCVRWWWGELEVKSGGVTEFICMCQREPERGFVCELLKERGGVREGGKRDSQLGIPE